jgi:hypothetical protein
MNYSIASGNESAETGDPGRTSIHPSVLLSYIVSSVLPDMSSCFPCSSAADSEEEGGARDRSQYEEVPELGSYGGPQEVETIWNAEDHAAEPPAEANSSSGEEPQKAKAAIPHTSPASSPKETV